MSAAEDDLFTLLPPEERPRRRPRPPSADPDMPLLGGPLYWRPANRGYIVCSVCGHWSALIGADEVGDYRHYCPSPR